MNLGMLESVKTHWPEYLIEMACLGTFMLSACTFAAILGYPQSPAQMWIMNGIVRRVVMGIAMGLTAVCIIFSPLGKRSGAHMNPALTFTFWWLGKIASWDAFFYVCGQFAGGIGGVWLARVLLRSWVSHPSVNYAVTIPGRYGLSGAFLGELTITFVLMSVILVVSNHKSLARYTGLFAGSLVALYITFEAPISGMSMNPARTMGSAVSAHVWTALWIYFAAPVCGMLLAAELYVRVHGTRAVLCAKLHHDNKQRCIFNCGYSAMVSETLPSRIRENDPPVTKLSVTGLMR